MPLTLIGEQEVERWFGGWSFSNRLIVPTAKETLREDEGVSVADPGFCERVEGNGEGRGVSSPHVAPCASCCWGGGKMCACQVTESRSTV